MGISTAEAAASSAEEMLQAQTQVFHHAMAHIGSMSLKCVVELGIPDIIHAHGRPMTISDLLSKLPEISHNKAPFLPRFMRLLTQMGYFKTQKAQDEEGDDAYSLTLLSTILLKNSPVSLRAWVLGILSPYMTLTWQLASAWLQSEKPGCAVELEYGKSLWDLASESPEFNLMFNEFMAGDTRLLMKYVVGKCGEAFEGLRTLVDVGGGTGTAARAIAEAFPGLKCTVYDLPHVIASLPESPLVDAIAGSMFESVPEADAVFLKLILHDWTDEECVEILKKCRKAIPVKGGKVIIIDIVLKDRRDPAEVETQLLWDVSMLVSTDGKEREEDEWKKIFFEAGFADYKITPLGLRSLIEVFP